MTQKSKQQTPTRSAKAPVIYRRLLRYLKPHRGRFFLSLTMLLVFGATDGAIPYLLKRILDDVFGNQNTSMLWMLVAIIVGFSVARGICGFFQRYLSESVGLRIVEDIRNEIGRRLLTLSPSFFISQSTGSLISRVTNDTLLVQKAITDASVSILRDSVRVLALVASAIYLDPMLALISFIGLPLGMIPVIRFGKSVRRFSMRGQEKLGGLTSILYEMILGNSVIQSFRLEKHQSARFAEENRHTRRMLEKAVKYSALSAPVNEILSSFAIAAVLVYGGLSVISGVRTQGDFIAFLSAMFLLYEPLKKMGRLNSTILTGVASAERVFDVLDATSEIAELPDATELQDRTLSIAYRNVYFHYPQQQLTDVAPENDAAAEQRFWALRDVSFNVRAGETAALVGMSGGGKSTLVHLLSRFYDSQRGSIQINGIDIKSYTVGSLRESIAVVSQNTFLFNDTVFNNIAFGRLGASQQEIFAAANAAYAHDFVSKLPEGYDTKIGDQGFRLSGGERARIALARALLKNAPILVLDEATANLDSESEKLVQNAIEKLMVGRTVLVIAHRLSTILRADKILVVVNGEIVESGTHQELLKVNGEYAKLYQLQFAHTQKAVA